MINAVCIERYLMKKFDEPAGQKPFQFLFD